MIPVEISEAADADLAAILEHGWNRFGEAAAMAYLRGFDHAFGLIGEHPLIGALQDTVAPPIHSLPHGRHRIWYDVFEDRAVVQRVLHKAMDAERRLEKR